MAKEMNITAHVFPTEEFGPNLLAFASVTLGDCFVINNLRVMDSVKGPFVSMPSRKIAEGEYQDVAFPVTREMRESMNAAVLEEYFDQASLPEEMRGYEPDFPPAPTTAERVGIRRLSLTPDSGNKLATAQVVIGGCFVIDDVRVMDSVKGPFVAMPSRVNSDGEFRDIAYPITTQMRENLNVKVMDKYQAAVQAAERKAATPERIKEDLDAAKRVADQSKEEKTTKGGKESRQKQKSGQDKPDLASTIEAAQKEAEARDAARQQAEQGPPSRSAPAQETP